MRKSLFRLSLVLHCLVLPSVAVLSGCGSSSDKEKTREEIKAPDGEPDSDQNPSDAISLTFSEEDSSQTQTLFDEKVAPSYKPIFDGSLTSAQKTLVQKDLIVLSELRFDAAKLGKFGTIFGNPNEGGLLAYLSERMKVLVGADAKGFVGTPSGSYAISAFADEAPKKAFMTAQNIGTLLWYNRVIFEKSAFLQGKSANYEVKSMHDGVIMFLEGYLTTLRNRSGEQQRISSPATLIHEARHSDCSVQLSATQVSEIRRTEDILKGDLKCGHLHVPCPSGALKGLNACDNDYWGAYSMSGFFSQMVETSCTNCQPEDIAVAKIAKLDSLSRVLPVLKNPKEPFPEPNLQHFELP